MINMLENITKGMEAIWSRWRRREIEHFFFFFVEKNLIDKAEMEKRLLHTHCFSSFICLFILILIHF